MSKTVNVAVFGVKSLVGEALLELLAEHEFPVAKLYALESGTEEGDSVSFGGRSIDVNAVADFDVTDAAILFLCDSNEALAAQALAAECVVLQAESEAPGSLCRVAGINTDNLDLSQVIAGPLGLVSVLSQVLQASVELEALQAVDVHACLAVAGQGRKAVEALAGQTARLLNAQGVENTVFPRQMAFNVHTRLGKAKAGSDVAYEQALSAQLAGLLSLPPSAVQTTAWVVPVFFGDTVQLRMEFADAVNRPSLLKKLKAVSGLEFLDDNDSDGFPTPVSDAANSEQTWLSRLRIDQQNPRVVHLTVVADSVRKGAALNILQVADFLLKAYLS
jgi:aspartate-semialdehyde dehydrogenase